MPARKTGGFNHPRFVAMGKELQRLMMDPVPILPMAAEPVLATGGDVADAATAEAAQRYPVHLRQGTPAQRAVDTPPAQRVRLASRLLLRRDVQVARRA